MTYRLQATVYSISIYIEINSKQHKACLLYYTKTFITLLHELYKINDVARILEKLPNYLSHVNVVYSPTVVNMLSYLDLKIYNVNIHFQVSNILSGNIKYQKSGYSSYQVSHMLYQENLKPVFI